MIGCAIREFAAKYLRIRAMLVDGLKSHTTILSC
jgi:hypothetical protein